jgi:CheY-like chemotaxis protein
MSSAMKTDNRRILIIDDNRAIHEDFGKILGSGTQNSALAALEDELFGETAPVVASEEFELCSAFQGQDGFAMVHSAEAAGQPFAMAFVDVRMPPGWDGVETIHRMWQVSQSLQTVICTAYSDYSWEQIVERLGESDRLLFIRKPFDPAEVRQVALTLTEKWRKLRQAAEPAR